MPEHNGPILYRCWFALRHFFPFRQIEQFEKALGIFCIVIIMTLLFLFLYSYKGKTN